MLLLVHYYFHRVILAELLSELVCFKNIIQVFIMVYLKKNYFILFCTLIKLCTTTLKFKIKT